MEEKKQSNTLKTVLLVFGIIFSIILVPGLIAGIPVGGAGIALSQTVSQESIEKTIQEAKLSEKVYQTALDEVLKEVQNNDTLQTGFLEDVVRESVTVELADEIVAECIDSVYNGTDPQVQLDSALDGVRNAMEDISENGFEDLYSACFEETESRYFSGTFIQSTKDTIEQELLAQYPDFVVSSLEELETAYDAQFGAGAYEKIFDEKIAEYENGWKDDILDGLDEEMDAVIEEVEVEVNQALSEVSQDPDLRFAFDTLNEVGEKKETIKVVAYAIVLVAVLLLLVCYWFGTAGYVVPAVALILGGALCKLITLSKDMILTLIRDEIGAIPEAAEYGELAVDICNGIITPFFAEMSKFGITMVGIGVLLVLIAILRGVLKKNATAAGEVM